MSDNDPRKKDLTMNIDGPSAMPSKDDNFRSDEVLSPEEGSGASRSEELTSPDSDGEDVIEKLKKELSKQQETSAPLKKSYPGHPSTHSSQMRQDVSGKFFKKCKSATFQIDGATYTIGLLRFTCSYVTYLIGFLMVSLCYNFE